MATPDSPALSHYVNGNGGYLLSISAGPRGDTFSALIIHVGEDTVLDETRHRHGQVHR